MIKPTVGRVVWYHEGEDTFAAIISKVWSDTYVNLAVFTASGVATNRTSVLLHQDGNECPQTNYAEWMPYQKGQAAKTEELISKLTNG